MRDKLHAYRPTSIIIISIIAEWATDTRLLLLFARENVERKKKRRRRWWWPRENQINGNTWRESHGAA